MLVPAVILFATAAVGGAYLAFVRARSGQNPPLAVAIVHGVLAASGLITLLVHVVRAELPTLPTVAAGLFVVAALGGFALVATHLRRTLISLALVGVHAVAAVTGFVLLVWAAFASAP